MPASNVNLARFGTEKRWDAGIFEGLLTKESIIRKVEARVASYASGRDADSRKRWLDLWFHPTVERAVIGFVSWKSIAGGIAAKDPHTGQAYAALYSRCLELNRDGGI